MKRHVGLDYTLGAGWLAPWLDGLRDGNVIASSCGSCDTIHFPPLRACSACGLQSDGWRTLAGGATVLYRSTGADGDIAMVRFDGANSATIARAEGLPEGATRCTLAASPDDPPILTLQAEPST